MSFVNSTFNPTGVKADEPRSKRPKQPGAIITVTEHGGISSTDAVEKSGELSQVLVDPLSPADTPSTAPLSTTPLNDTVHQTDVESDEDCLPIPLSAELSTSLLSPPAGSPSHYNAHFSSFSSSDMSESGASIVYMCMQCVSTIFVSLACVCTCVNVFPCLIM